MALNHFEHYKTARQFMLCDYFFRLCNGNGLPNRHCVDMLRSTYWTQEIEELLDKWNHGKDPKDVQIITREMYEQIPETTKTETK